MVHEEFSVFEKISRREAQLLTEAASKAGVGRVLVTVRLQKNPVEVSVKLFDSNIVGSPRIINLHLPRDRPVPAASDQSLAVFDTTHMAPGFEVLDSSDLNSLDITGRRIQQELNASQR